MKGKDDLVPGQNVIGELPGNDVCILFLKFLFYISFYFLIFV